MTNLMRASQELFRRTPDERYGSQQELYDFCKEQQGQSTDRWHLPARLLVNGQTNLRCNVDNDGAFLMHDWSFTQLGRMALVGKRRGF